MPASRDRWHHAAQRFRCSWLRLWLRLGRLRASWWHTASLQRHAYIVSVAMGSLGGITLQALNQDYIIIFNTYANYETLRCNSTR
jgi:hypothetical protein